MADADLLALLNGAVGRTTTLTAELRIWQHHSRSQRAFEVARYARIGGFWMVAQRGPVLSEESETVWRVVQGPGGRYAAG